MRRRFGVPPMGVEALHLHRLLRQRELGHRHRRRIRLRSSPLPRHISRLRARFALPQIRPRRRLPPQPRLGRQARRLRADARPRAALPDLRRSRQSRDRDGDPRLEPAQRERLQAADGQQPGEADVRRRIRALRAPEVGDVGAERGIGDAAAAVGGEWEVLQDGFHGAFVGVWRCGVVECDCGQPWGSVGGDSEEFGQVLCRGAGEVYVAQLGGQVCRCYQLCYFAGDSFISTSFQFG